MKEKFPLYIDFWFFCGLLFEICLIITVVWQFKSLEISWAWCCTPLIPVLRMQRRKIFNFKASLVQRVPGQPRQHKETLPQKNKTKQKRFIYVYVYEHFACMYVCVPHACLLSGEVKRTEVTDGCKHHVDAGYWTWVPQKNRKNSQPLSCHLSNLLCLVLKKGENSYFLKS